MSEKTAYVTSPDLHTRSMESIPSNTLDASPVERI
jgi:hypothetical protein